MLKHFNDNKQNVKSDVYSYFHKRKYNNPNE